MTTSFKRAAMAGFTLIELLIVVIILAIISAIAIPQFSAATSDAQQSAADANLAAVRNAIELYRAQHAGNAYPGVRTAMGGADCTGEVVMAGGANSQAALIEQLSYATNREGQACSIAGGEYRFGPYLRQGIPVNPFTDSAVVRITTTGAKLVATAGTAEQGWAYDTVTGEFILNQPAAADADAGT